MITFAHAMKTNVENKIALPVLISLCLAHLLNDLLQSTVTATYPMIKADLDLSFAQIGSITLVYQIAASVFQPVVGLVFDKRPFRWSLALAATFTLLGIIGMSFSNSISAIYVSVFIIGLGSSILHPEASRFASLASAGRRGLAQSIFQVGGNFGGSIGPLLIALIVAPVGRRNLLWFTLFSAASYACVAIIGNWYKDYLRVQQSKTGATVRRVRPLGLWTTVTAIGLIVVLIISKYIYLESIRSYYTFYLIDKFDISVSASQLCLFSFLFATAAGTLIGGPVGDKIGRKWVILLSILCTAPFSILMPAAGFAGTLALGFMSGFTISSAFPAILLYAQELLPGRLGLVSGLFFGFAFGIGGIASAVIGNFIDIYGIENVYRAICLSPLLGLVAIFLPDLSKK